MTALGDPKATAGIDITVEPNIPGSDADATTDAALAIAKPAIRCHRA